MALTAKILFPGRAEGPLLRLTEPLGFWGGVDPDSGDIINVRHPQYRRNIGGTVLAIPMLIGSSSSSAVLLELIRNGHAPKAIILGAADAILIVGCLVGRELGYTGPPVLQVDRTLIADLPAGGYLIEADADVGDQGRLRVVDQVD